MTQKTDLKFILRITLMVIIHIIFNLHKSESCYTSLLSYRDKLLQTGWFKTTEMNYLTILNNLCSKSRYQKDDTPFGSSRKKSILCLYQLLGTVWMPWLSASSLQILPLQSHCLLLFCLHYLHLLLSYEDCVCRCNQD